MQAAAIGNLTQGQKSRALTMLAALVLLFPCISYGILADAPLIPAMAAVLLAGSVVINSPVPDSTRAVIYTITVSLTVAVILNQIYEVDGDRFFMPMPPEITVPFLIGCGIGFTYMRHNARTLIAILTFSFTCFLLQGTCLNDPSHNVRLPVAGTIWANRYITFGIFSLLSLLAALPLIFHAQPRRQVGPALDGRRRSRRAWYGISTLLVLGASVGCAFAVPPLVQHLDRWMSPLLNLYLQVAATPSLFSGSVNLNQTLQLKHPEQENRVILHARSESMPGYMRGRTFVYYDEGRWHSLVPEQPMPFMPVDRDLSVQRFVVVPELAKQSRLPVRRMDIYPSPLYRSDVLFAPGSTQVIEAIAERMLTNEHGVAAPQEWDSAGGYSLYAELFTPMSVWNGPRLRNETAGAYLEVPEELVEPLDAFSKQIFDRPAGHTQADILRLTTFLIDHAEYELGVPMNGRDDPVMQFLLELRRGHCELFASAAALLLRSRGIPCRYVTGFVVMEPLGGSDTWIARLGHAHAWVEAYDIHSDTWILVEATPPSGIPQVGESGGFLANLREQLAQKWAAIFTLIKRGYFADAILTGLKEVWNGITWLFWRGPWYVGWAMLIVTVLLLLRLPRRATARGEATAEGILHLHEILALIDRALDHLRISRQPQTSIGDLIQRVKEKDAAAATLLTPLLEAYQQLRFSGDERDPDAIQKLKKRALEELHPRVLRALRRKEENQ